MNNMWLFVPSEEFNDRILCPELSDSQKTMLHEELKKIYETYCLDESIDKIRFDPFIVEEIRNSRRRPLSSISADCVLAARAADSFVTPQSRRGHIRRWWSCRPWGVCSRPTSTSSPSWRTSSRPCSVTAMRSVLSWNDDASGSGSNCLKFLLFEFICSVLLQYFRQLLRGAESPARSSRMSRSVLCQIQIV